jgi:hypothetical protein
VWRNPAERAIAQFFSSFLQSCVAALKIRVSYFNGTWFLKMVFSFVVMFFSRKSLPRLVVTARLVHGRWARCETRWPGEREKRRREARRCGCVHARTSQSHNSCTPEGGFDQCMRFAIDLLYTRMM